LRGDRYTAATLEVILKDWSDFDNENPVKVNLFKCSMRFGSPLASSLSIPKPVCAALCFMGHS
jgi:hypothetical protein